MSGRQTGGAGETLHDAVVIGGGIGGLTAACYLARAGMDVVLAEAGERAGGLCRTFAGNGLTWNLSLYSLRGCRPGGPFAGILDELGLGGEISFHHSSRSYLVNTGRTSLPFSTDLEETLEGAGRLAADGGEKLRALLERIEDFHPARDYAELSGRTFGEVAGEEGVSGRLLEAFSAPLMISLGLPPDRASAYFAFLKYQLIFREGVSYPRGGPDRLVGSLAAATESAGGMILLSERVEEITVGPAGEKLVRTAGGRRLRGRHLIINADATWAMKKLSAFLPPKFRERPRGLKPGLSAVLLLLKTDQEVLLSSGLRDFPHVIFLRGGGLGETYRRLRAGGAQPPVTILGLTSPATWEPAGGPADPAPVTAFFPASAAASPPARESLLEAILEATETAKGRIEAVKIIGPEEIIAMSGNREGSFCGWEMGPERYGPARLPRQPLPGVYLTGHWTDPGPSLLNAALSGRGAASSILGKERRRGVS